MNQRATFTDESVRLAQAVERIQSRDDLVAFARDLLGDLQHKPDGRDLASYLEALAAWVEDMPGYFQNRGEPMPDQPTWKTLGQILLAATVYE